MSAVDPPARAAAADTGAGTEEADTAAADTGAAMRTEDADPARSGLGRSSSVMAAGTALSRVTGFARSVVILAALGQTLSGDAFTLANTIPNNLYILVAGGALNAVFIPQLVRAMRTDTDGGVLFAQRLLTLTVTVLLAVSAVAVLAAPWLVRLFAGSELHHGPGLPYLDLSISYARWCLPQIACYGLFVIVGQILNARGRFGPMMFAPILNNVVAIAVFGAFLVLSSHPLAADVPRWQVILLGGGSTLGVVVQAVVLLPPLRRAGVPLHPRLGWRAIGLGKVGRLAGWTLLFVLVNQVAYVVVSRIATSINAAPARPGAPAGGNGAGLTTYQNAFLIFQLPHALVAVSLVTALLPRMSRAAVAGSLAGVRRDTVSGLRVLAVTSIPAAAAFAVLGRDIAVTLFSATTGGTTSVAQAAVIGSVLSGFALAALVFSSQYLLLRGFYAFEDTRTPFLVQLVVATVNVTGALAGSHLAAPRGPVAQLVAVALAYGVAYLVGIVLSAALLRRRLEGLDLSGVVQTAVRSAVAALVAAVVAAALDRLLHLALPDTPGAAPVRLVVAGTGLVAVYVGLARRMRVAEIATVLEGVARRLPGRSRRRGR